MSLYLQFHLPKKKKTLKKGKEKESRYEAVEGSGSKEVHQREKKTAKTINLVQESHSINELGDDPGHASFVPRVTDLKKAKDSKNLKKIGKGFTDAANALKRANYEEPLDSPPPVGFSAIHGSSQPVAKLDPVFHIAKPAIQYAQPDVALDKTQLKAAFQEVIFETNAAIEKKTISEKEKASAKEEASTFIIDVFEMTISKIYF